MINLLRLAALALGGSAVPFQTVDPSQAQALMQASITPPPVYPPQPAVTTSVAKGPAEEPPYLLGQNDRQTRSYTGFITNRAFNSNVLSVAGEFQNGAIVTSRPYNCQVDGKGQRWEWTDVVGQMRLVGTELCLDAGRFSDVRNGVSLQVVRCDGQSGGLPGVRAQQWRVRSSERHSVPSVELMEPRAPFRPTGLCVDLTDGISAAGTRMRLWGCSSTLEQAWGPA